MRLWLDITALVGSAIFGAYLWRSEGSNWLAILSLSVASIFAVMLVSAFLIIPPLVFRREPKFLDTYSLTFSEDGIHFSTAHIDSNLEWSLYSRALVDPCSYILYHGRQSFTVIPKRAFQDVDQQNAFEQLLTKKILKIVAKQ
jgi:hypothetical protein